jgi:serine/threonine protein kinase
MGEVYRAMDTELGREVALKILPEAFVRDPERMGRFRREAQVLASLNHPNIATIHGLEDSGGVQALVMELVEGPTLAERVKSSPLPVDEALPIARQMAEALEYAHERGIVHRDLKPANLKVTPDAVVKVLDFGLAKAFNAQGSAFNLKPNDSPTLSIASTQAGVILGTAAYMSPEQAKGKSVDRRADIWAFGCVLFEMLTGKQAFEGETVSDVLAAVIMKDPDWSALPSDMPAAIERLIRRCLVKDPRQRVQSIGDARIAIEEVLSDSPQDASSFVAIAASRIPAPAWRRALPWSIAALAVVAAVFATLVFRSRTNPAATMRFTLAPPAEGEFAADLGAAAVLCPDGSRLAYCLRTGEKIQMYVRELSQAQATLLPGTNGAQNPFFSPDGD